MAKNISNLRQLITKIFLNLKLSFDLDEKVVASRLAAESVEGTGRAYLGDRNIGHLEEFFLNAINKKS